MDIKTFAIEDFSAGFAHNKFDKEVSTSSISPNYLGCENHEGVVSAYFEEELSAADDALLSDIVANHSGVELIKKQRKIILNEILANVSSQEQADRIMDAFDSSATLLAALDNCNYSLARSRVDKLVTKGSITEDDRTLAFNYIPEE